MSGKPKDMPEKTLSNQLLAGATPAPKGAFWPSGSSESSENRTDDATDVRGLMADPVC